MLPFCFDLTPITAQNLQDDPHPTTMSSPHWNTGTGDGPFDPVRFLVAKVVAVAIIGLIGIVLSKQALRLSLIPVSLLWILYYVVGMVFHLSNTLTAELTFFGFLGPGAMHVYIEVLLCVKSLSRGGEAADWWGRAWTIYFVVTTFLTLSLWEPTGLFVFGSLVVLPADVLTIPAALAVMARSPYRTTYSWYLGLMWLINGPLVLFIFAQLTWMAKTPNNWVGVSFFALQIQYILMGLAIIAVFGRYSESGTSHEEAFCIDQGILPTHDQETAIRRGQAVWLVSGGMKWGLVVTTAILGATVVAAVVLPLAFGFLDWNMLWINACRSFMPGATC